MNPYPDPLVTASVYCEGYSDALLDAAVRPFRQVMESVDRAGFLWTLRFGARGEHVKLRVHASADKEEYLRERLVETIDSFLASLPESEASPGKLSGSYPVIDPEDAGAERHPDRSWCWTTYRRSPFVLGAEKLAEDERLVGLFTHAQGAITEIVLTHLAPHHAEPRFATRRQTLFLRLVLASLTALGFDCERRDTYLRHHRDWLIRFLVAKKKSGDVTPETMLDLYRERIESMNDTMLAVRRNLAAADQEPGRDTVFAMWQQRLVEFFDHATSYRGKPEYDLDPYTDDHALLPLFKLLHGTANQFGIKIPHELYVYQMLVTANEGIEAC